MSEMQVDIKDETLDVLRSTAERLGIDICEALRQGIAVYRYLSDAEAAGSNILIQDPENGSSTTLNFGNNNFILWEQELEDIE